MDKHSHSPQVWKYVWAARLPQTRTRVIQDIDFSAPNGCWNWTGRLNESGYGVLTVSENGLKKIVLAHRLSLHLSDKPVPENLTVDHLCRNRRCVNPDHLDQVSLKENVLRGESQGSINSRKTHCPSGHAYDELNTIFETRQGTDRVSRSCRTCKRKRDARRRQMLRK